MPPRSGSHRIDVGDATAAAVRRPASSSVRALLRGCVPPRRVVGTRPTLRWGGIVCGADALQMPPSHASIMTAALSGGVALVNVTLGTPPISELSGIGQMVYVAERDELYLTSIYSQVILVCKRVTADLFLIPKVAAVPVIADVTVFAGALGLSGPVYSGPVAPSQARFDLPLGLVALFPAPSTSHERLRLSRAPFALLVSSIGLPAVQLINLHGNHSVRVVAGNLSASGHMLSVGPAPGLSVLFSQPHYLADMLDGTYAVAVASSNCIVVMRSGSSPTAVYTSDATFGDVMVELFAGKCGASAPVGTVPDGTPAFDSPVLSEPAALVIDPLMTSAYIALAVGGLVKITPIASMSPSLRTFVAVPSLGGGQYVSFHPVFPDSLLIGNWSSGRVTVVDIQTSQSAIWAIPQGNGSLAAQRGRTFLALPQGGMLLSFGAQVEQPWLKLTCCFPGWEVTRSATPSLSPHASSRSRTRASASLSTISRTLSWTHTERSQTISWTNTSGNGTSRTNTTSTSTTSATSTNTTSATSPPSTSTTSTTSTNTTSAPSPPSTSTTNTTSATSPPSSSTTSRPSTNGTNATFNITNPSMPSVVAALTDSAIATASVTTISAAAVLFANPAAAQQAARAQATIAVASRCQEAVARRQAATRRNQSTSSPTAAAMSDDETWSTALPSFPMALLPMIGRVGSDNTRATHRACVLGNLVFVASVSLFIWMMGAGWGALYVQRRNEGGADNPAGACESPVARGLRLVRWPGSVLLPCALAMEGVVSSATFLLVHGGGHPAEPSELAIDVILFVIGTLAVSLEVAVMAFWGRWGRDRASVIRVVDPRQYRPLRRAVVLSLGVQYRWGPNAAEDEAALAARGIVFSKCHGPTSLSPPLSSSSCVAAAVDGKAAARDGLRFAAASFFRQRWSPLYCAMDLVLSLGTFMAQGAATASPDTTCLGAAATICILATLALMLSLVLRPFLSPAKNLVGNTSALLCCAGAFTLVAAISVLVSGDGSADPPADESRQAAAVRLLWATTVIATAGSVVSGVGCLLSVAQRIYALWTVYDGASQRLQTELLLDGTAADASVDDSRRRKEVDGGRGVAMRLLPSRFLLGDVELQATAARAAAPSSYQPEQQHHPQHSVVSDGHPPLLGSSHAARMLSSCETLGPPLSPEVPSCPTDAFTCRPTYRRTAEGQRLYDELEYLLSAHSPDICDDPFFGGVAPPWCVSLAQSGSTASVQPPQAQASHSAPPPPSGERAAEDPLAFLMQEL